MISFGVMKLNSAKVFTITYVLFTKVGPMARSTTDMAIFLDAMVPKERRPNVDYCGGSYAECLLKRNPQVKLLKNKINCNWFEI